MDRQANQQWQEEARQRGLVANQASVFESRARIAAPMEYRASNEDIRPRRDEQPTPWGHTQHAYTQGLVQQQDEQRWTWQHLQHDEHYQHVSQGTFTLFVVSEEGMQVCGVGIFVSQLKW